MAAATVSATETEMETAMAKTTTIKQQSTYRGSKRNGGYGDGNGHGNVDGDRKSEQWQQWRQHGVAACSRA